MAHGGKEMHLYSKDVATTGEVARLFGEELGLLVCRPGRFIRPWFSIPDGCYALVTKFGQDLDHASGAPVWPAGFHWGPPWVKVQNIVTKQSVVFNMPVKGCKTQDNVTVQINLSIVFRIMGDEAYAHAPRCRLRRLHVARAAPGQTHTHGRDWALFLHVPPA